MSEKDPLAEHKRLKQVQGAAKKLTKHGPWNYAGASSAHLRRLQERQGELHQDLVYAQSVFCPECKALRDESGDNTSLCTQHLAEAFRV